MAPGRSRAAGGHDKACRQRRIEWVLMMGCRMKGCVVHGLGMMGLSGS